MFRLQLVRRMLSTAPAPPTFFKKPDQIQKETAAVISRSSSLLDKIASNGPSFDNVVSPFASMDNDVIDAANTLGFYQYVSPDASLREASVVATQQLSDFSIEAGKREDVWVKVRDLRDASPKLEPVDQRYLEKIASEFERAGLSLDKAKRDQLTTLEKELSSLCISFHTNLGADNSFQLFTKEQLQGVPASVLDQFEKVDGKYKVTYQAPDVTPVMKYCTNPNTRKQMFVGSENRVPENGPLFARALELRREIAALLGYENHAAYVLEDRMAKTPEAVRTFLEDLLEKAKSMGATEKEQFLKIKQETEPDATEVYAWDVAFLTNKVVERDFKVDQELVSQYFPMESTVKKMFAIFEKLMNLTFKEIPLSEDQRWHDDVICYAIHQGSDFKGYLYLDMYPRENKYGHFANFGLYQGNLADGQTNYPVSALVCNFPKPSTDRPSLLYHQDVVTFFHELGHGIHATLGLTKYGRFSGTNVARDFVETPSQLLENWTWDPEQLKQLSSHYKTGEPLPDDTIAALVKSKDANPATFLLRQLFFGLFDLRAHTEPSFDAAVEWQQLRDNVIGIPSNERLAGYNQFGHLMGGYDSGYYGYLWALVFAADIWSTLFAKAPLDTAAGAKYRDGILAQGSSRDEAQMLKTLLGREPNNVAFLKELGLA